MSSNAAAAAADKGPVSRRWGGKPKIEERGRELYLHAFLLPLGIQLLLCKQSLLLLLLLFLFFLLLRLHRHSRRRHWSCVRGFGLPKGKATPGQRSMLWNGRKQQGNKFWVQFLQGRRSTLAFPNFFQTLFFLFAWVFDRSSLSSGRLCSLFSLPPPSLKAFLLFSVLLESLSAPFTVQYKGIYPTGGRSDWSPLTHHHSPPSTTSVCSATFLGKQRFSSREECVIFTYGRIFGEKGG